MSPRPVISRFNICWTPEECDRAFNFLKSCDLIATDIETIPWSKPKIKKVDVGNDVKVPEAGQFRFYNDQFIITLVTYTGITPSGHIASFALPLVTEKSLTANVPTHIEYIIDTIRRINDLDIRTTLHNGVYDCAWFLRYHMPIRNYAYDSMTMWWSRYPDLPRTLSFVSSILLDDHQYWKQGRKETDFIQYCMYGMRDTEATLRNTLYLSLWLKNDESTRKNFNSAHLRCLTGLGMSVKGMKVDFDKLESFEKALTDDTIKATERLRYLVANPDFNPNSPLQKKDLLYEQLGVRPRGPKGRFVADKAKASTGAIPLRTIRTEHPIYRIIVDGITGALTPSKQLSNVIGMRHYGGRFRTGYDGVGTTTTRFSSRGDAFGYGGNAQNVRKDYRPLAIADTDSFILEVDFSAADDVFVSYESGEEKKITVIEQGLDTHSFNAAEVFFPHWTYDSVVAGKKAKDPAVIHPITGIRQVVKKVTHGCNYLMAGITLFMTCGRATIVGAAKELGHADAGSWSQDQLVGFCEDLDRAYRKYYPKFRRAGPESFYVALHDELTRTGGFTTIFGYHQRFLADPNDQGTLRAVAATSGQANTAGRVNMALEELDHGVRTVRFRDGDAPDRHEPARPITERTHGVSCRLQTHDSITFNVNYRHPKWRDGIRDVLHVMSRPVVCKGRTVRVGLEADVSWAWGGKGPTVSNVEQIELWLDEEGIKTA